MNKYFKALVFGTVAAVIMMAATASPMKGRYYNEAPIKDTFGAWCYASLTTPNYKTTFAPYDFKGIHLICTWADLKPTKTGAYNWPLLDSNLYIAKAMGWLVGLQPQTGQNSATWAMAEAGTFTTTGGNDNGPYPYYFNPVYKGYLYAFLKDFTQHIASLPDSIKNIICYQQNAEGSTGDNFAYKGTPVNYNWDGQTFISVADWETYRIAFWDSVNTYQQLYCPTLTMMINGGNDGEKFDYVAFNYNRAYNKEGNLSHQYNFSGEKTYFNRDITFFSRNPTYTLPSGRFTLLPSRGEMQGPALSPTKPHKENFVLFASASAGGLGMFNVTQGYVNSAKESYETRSSSYPIDFYNEYSLKPVENSGFSLPRDGISYDDTARFPEAAYGPVIDPLKIRRYTGAIAEINASDNDETYKDWLKIGRLEANLNPSRKTAIKALFPEAQESTSSSYLRDFGVNLVGNYEKNLTQLNPNSNSVGRWRVGPDTSFYGRYARQFKIEAGQCKWLYDIDNKLIKTATADTVRITVTYLDKGFGKWRVKCFKCNEVALQTISNTNQNVFKTVSFTIPKFRFRQNGYDFAIEYVSGETTIFGLVEVKNLSKI